MYKTIKTCLKCILSVLFIINALPNINAQNFEGKLIYVAKFINKSNLSIITDTTKLYIKENMLRASHSASSTSETYFISGKFYNVNKAAQVIILDTSKISAEDIFENKMLRLRKTKFKKKINKQLCIKYEMEAKENNDIIYSSFWLTNKWNIIFSFSNYLFKGKGIVVKAEKYSKNITLILNLIEISPMSLDNSFFKLPDYPIEMMNLNSLSKAYIKEHKK
jgi:hypothetical protein